MKRSVIKDQSHNCSILPLAQPSPARLVVQRRNLILWEVKQMFRKNNKKNKLIPPEQEHIINIICSNLGALTPLRPLRARTSRKTKVLMRSHVHTVHFSARKPGRIASLASKEYLKPDVRAGERASSSTLVFISSYCIYRQDLTREFVTHSVCMHKNVRGSSQSRTV